jgi:putative CocE/NonD family hydrolase
VRNGVPALMLSGWFDVYQRGVLLNYATFQNAWARRRNIYGPMAAGQTATPRYQAVIGPWFHNPVGMGEWIQQIHLEWFDHWLKGVPTRLTSTSTPLHAFELGSRHWLDAGAYPLPQARVRRLPIGPSRGVDRLVWTGASSPCNRHPDQWSTGFGGYVSAFVGTPVNPCAQDDRTTQAGALTYTTSPLTRELTLAGPGAVGVNMSSTTRDSELVATLEDISPDGASYPLTTGALLGSLRAVDRTRSWPTLPYHAYTAASRRDLTPGRVTLQQIEVPPVFARLAKGHRLRLTLASSVTHLQPTAAQLPGLAGGVYEIHPSYVDLPLADPASLPASSRNWGDCNAQC